MITEVFIPKLGANMVEGTVNIWYKKEGDRVRVGEPIVEVITDKANVIVEAPGSGFLRRILVGEGETVPVSTVIGIIAEEELPPGSFKRIIPKPPPKKPSYPAPVIVKSAKVKASPAARALARERGVDLSSIIGTGPGGSITSEDVEEFLAGKAPEKLMVAIVGAGEYAAVVLEILNLRGEVEPAGFLDDDQEKIGKEIHGLPVLGSCAAFPELRDKGIESCILTVGNPYHRRNLAQAARSAGMGFTRAIHPRAVVSSYASLGEGVVVEAGAIVSFNTTIGDHVFITQNCSTSHDNIIGDYCHLAPGCNLGGNVKIEECTLVGVGASVGPRVHIGKNVIICPGAAVTENLPDAVVVDGVPARIIGQRRVG